MNTCPECGNENPSLSRKLCANCTATKHSEKYQKVTKVVPAVACPECGGKKFEITTRWKGAQSLDTTTHPTWTWKDIAGKQVFILRAWCADCNIECTEVLEKAGIMFSEE